MRYRSARTFISKMPLLALLLILCAAQSQAEIYKWTDADGNVHFTDRKTETHENAEKVELKVKKVSPEDEAAAKQRHAAAIEQRQQRSANAANQPSSGLTESEKYSRAKSAKYCQYKRDAVKEVEAQRAQLKLNGYTDDGLARIAERLAYAHRQVKLYCN